MYILFARDQGGPIYCTERKDIVGIKRRPLTVCVQLGGCVFSVGSIGSLLQIPKTLGGFQESDSRGLF